MNPYLTRTEHWIDRYWGGVLIAIVLAPWAALYGGVAAIRFFYQ